MDSALVEVTDEEIVHALKDLQPEYAEIMLQRLHRLKAYLTQDTDESLEQ